MKDNLYLRNLDATVPRDGRTINLVEERIEPLYPKSSRHDNTRLFFNTLLWCYCTAALVQIFTFLPIPRYYVSRYTSVLLGSGVVGYGLLWTFTKKQPTKKEVFTGLAIIAGVVVGL